jgi:hypothetical protein
MASGGAVGRAAFICQGRNTFRPGRLEGLVRALRHWIRFLSAR